MDFVTHMWSNRIAASLIEYSNVKYRAKYRHENHRLAVTNSNRPDSGESPSADVYCSAIVSQTFRYRRLPFEILFKNPDSVSPIFRKFHKHPLVFALRSAHVMCFA